MLAIAGAWPFIVLYCFVPEIFCKWIFPADVKWHWQRRHRAIVLDCNLCWTYKSHILWNIKFHQEQRATLALALGFFFSSRWLYFNSIATWPHHFREIGIASFTQNSPSKRLSYEFADVIICSVNVPFAERFHTIFFLFRFVSCGGFRCRFSSCFYKCIFFSNCHSI